MCVCGVLVYVKALGVISLTLTLTIPPEDLEGESSSPALLGPAAAVRVVQSRVQLPL